MTPNPFDAIMERLDKIEERLRGIENRLTFAFAPKPEPNDRMNVQEACELLNRTKSWIFKKTMNREIPFKKFGSHVVFSRHDLLVWMEEQTKPVLTQLQISEIMSERLAKAASRKIKY